MNDRQTPRLVPQPAPAQDPSTYGPGVSALVGLRPYETDGENVVRLGDEYDGEHVEQDVGRRQLARHDHHGSGSASESWKKDNANAQRTADELHAEGSSTGTPLRVPALSSAVASGEAGMEAGPEKSS